MGLEGMDKILSESLGKRPGIRRQLEAELVLRAFAVACIDVVGEQARGAIKPLHLKNRVLTVACDIPTGMPCHRRVAWKPPAHGGPAFRRPLTPLLEHWGIGHRACAGRARRCTDAREAG